MAQPTTGPCGPWILPEQVIQCCSGLNDPPDMILLEQAVTFATAILFRLSGRQFPGLCERVIRPCFGSGGGCGGAGWSQWPMGWSFATWDQAAGGWSFPSVPYLVDGEWFNAWGGCGNTCDLPSVRLPMPVAQVTEVVIDGEILDPSAYAVEQYTRLVRLDGHNWPCTQNRRNVSTPYPGLPDGTRDGTWQVTEMYGRGPGPDGEIAAARFACEIAKFMCNAADCQLPQRVRSIVREGVSLDFTDPLTFVGDGLTGVYEVDLWLHSVNPGGKMRRASVKRLDRLYRSRGFT